MRVMASNSPTALELANLADQALAIAASAFGGMAANDGPVPVRTLAHAGRLMREARDRRVSSLLSVRQILACELCW